MLNNTAGEMAVYCGQRELRKKEHFHPVCERIHLVSFITEMGGEIMEIIDIS